jgi:hypothetical protein
MGGSSSSGLGGSSSGSSGSGLGGTSGSSSGSGLGGTSGSTSSSSLGASSSGSSGSDSLNELRGRPMFPEMDPAGLTPGGTVGGSRTNKISGGSNG